MHSRDEFADSVLSDFRAHRLAVQGLVAEAERSRSLYAVIQARSNLLDAALAYSGAIRTAASVLHPEAANYLSERLVSFAAPGIGAADRHIRFLLQPQHGSDYYFDALGRRVRAEHYVRTLARKAAVDSELAQLREEGVTHVRVSYDRAGHPNQGRVVDLGDPQDCIEVFHPNTTARIEPCSDQT